MLKIVGSRDLGHAHF